MNDAQTPVVRRGLPQDAPALARLSAATFVETFGHLYPPEDLRKFLDESYSVDACEAQLKDSGIGIWIAFIGLEAIAFVTAGPCKLPVPRLEPTAGEIQRLYVLSQYQNLRLGSALLNTALDWLVANGRKPIYVGVWSENVGGQRLYGRYGFVKCGEYGFPVGDTVDQEFILRRD